MLYEASMIESMVLYMQEKLSFFNFRKKHAHLVHKEQILIMA